MALILSLMGLIIYNVAIFYYMTHIFMYKRNRIALLIQITVANIPLLILDMMLIPTELIALSMVLYCVILFIEIKTIFDANIVTTLFGVLCFAINIFAIRMIIICIIALVQVNTMNAVVDTLEKRLIIFSSAGMIAAGYTLITKKLLSGEKIRAMLLHTKNIIFATTLLGISYVYLGIMSLTFLGESEGSVIPVLNLKGGIMCLLGYINAIMCAYFFAKFKNTVILYEARTKEVNEKDEELGALEEVATYDRFTGLRNRKYALELIQQYVTDKVRFFITFIDMDGLKIVNDTYGHNEGDIYIKSTAEILKEIYRVDVCARLGGDEFVAIGKLGRDSYMPLRKAVKCVDNVRILAQKQSKDYETSVSYGIVVVNEDNTLLVSEILKLADERMYEYKKKHKKERVVKTFKFKNN